jgi:hypothetical protein
VPIEKPEHLAAEKTGPTREQNPHGIQGRGSEAGSKSGNVRSRSEMTRGALGQRKPNAGSSYRNPR